MGAQREGDGPGGGVLQIFQGHGQGERRRPGLQESALEKTFDFAEDTDALRVAVVAVDLWNKKKKKNVLGEAGALKASLCQ